MAEGDEITITRRGEAMPVLVGPDTFRRRSAIVTLEGAAVVRELLATGKDTPLDGVPGISAERAEVMVRELRADRSRR